MASKRCNVRVVGLLAVLLVMVACGPAAAPTVAPAQTPGAVTQPTAEPSGGGPVVIQLWSTAWFPSSIAGRMALVDEFNKQHEGKIKVEYIQGAWDTAETYVQNGIAAGGGIACVVEYHYEGALSWYRKGWVQDLRPYITPERRALMIEELWQTRTYPDDGAIVMNGTLLEEPTLVVLYNPKHLAAAGIEPATIDEPWTWDQFIENAKLLTLDANGKHLGEEGFDASNVVQWGFLPRLENEKVWEWGSFIAQQAQGKPVVRQENGRWGWYLDEKAKQAYDRFLSAVQVGIAPELAIGLSGDSLHQAFVDGKTSMILRETFAIPIILDSFPDTEIGAMPVPFQKGDKVLYKAAGEGMVIVKTCEHPEAAAEFLFWMMQPENLAPYAAGNGMLPANYAALDEEPLASDTTWKIIKDYLSRSEVVSVPFNPYWTEFRDTVVGPTLMEVVSGKRTFEEANKILEEQADQLLNQ
ncbi:MAG: extracellular solute-binding protein [Anaerolineae bacterium]|nr:extracellular solute-binding protein [Anaerolineae bacterium]